jgi:hypothetical protein
MSVFGFKCARQKIAVTALSALEHRKQRQLIETQFRAYNIAHVNNIVLALRRLQQGENSKMTVEHFFNKREQTKRMTF